MKFAAYTTLGFTIGAVVGFLWSNSTKSKISQNIATHFEDGKFIMSLDVKKTAIDGILDAIGAKPSTVTLGQNY